MPHLTSLPKLLDREVCAKNLRLFGWRVKGFAWAMPRPTMPDPVVVPCAARDRASFVTRSS